MINLTVGVLLILGVTVFIGAMRRLRQTVDRMEHTLARMEEAADQVAGAATKQRTRMEEATVVVAGDLAASVARADATEGPEGAAADAALRTGDTASAIRQRQAKP